MNDNPKNVYVFSGVILEASEEEKDLGVLTCSNLKWYQQINSCIRKERWI